MQFIVNVSESGFCELQLPDPHGELKTYSFRPVTLLGMARWGLYVQNVGEEKEYCVCWYPGHGWNCTCPDWKHRHRRVRSHTGPCKHILAAKGLRALLEKLSPQQLSPVNGVLK